MSQNPFRFGIVSISAPGPDEWTATARWAEEAGFSALVLPDMPPPVPAPFSALAVAAAATTTLEVGNWVLANDFRNPVTVAHEAATLDLLSGGRFRLGLGASHPGNAYAALGIPVESGAVRVARLAESAGIVNALLRGERVEHAGEHYTVAGASVYTTPPARKVPLVLAAGGRRAIELAAAEADTVALSTFSAEQLGRQRAWLEEAAGERFARIELGLRFTTPSSTVGPPMPADAPNILRGSAGQVVDALRRLRDRYGVSYVVLDETAARELTSVVEKLTGD